ncbi:Conserved_hypothetical protein [Hexamita inflata]|uniref:Myb-like domain-containing protein n=1 Tax=Hexamita inflata TaxID=28002 RepID=A0AA86REA8_9EUKA|nr:Conserved hypothetical protein [Hexamita inflata]
MSDYNRGSYNRDNNRGGDDRRGGFNREGGDDRRGGFRGGDDRRGGFGGRDGGDRRGGFGGRDGGFGGRGGDRNGGFQQKPKWSDEEVQQLKEMVATQKENGKVNWDAIGKEIGGRYGSTCFNKYTQISEPKWTPEEEQVLGKFWEANNNNFNINDVLEKLEGHSKRGTQFKLERLTQDGQFNPAYRMGKDEMQKTE